MQITSLYFFLLSLISIFIYYLLGQKQRVLYLIILSCAFVASYNFYLLLYVIIYSLINYFFGIWITESHNSKSIFRAGIIFNLAQLIILKYASFTFDPLLNLLNFNFNISVISKIIVPVGISFFTLQGIGYLVNVNMKWEKPETNFLHFFLYIIFYPRFLSGPVERSNHFLPQLKAYKSFDEQSVSDGLRMALFGLFKKVAIANQLSPFVIEAYKNLNTSGGTSLWILLLIQPLYLYFDFSGYTDIARGLARTLGIDLLPNFNRPLLSENMTTFWKRFHMSLSSWFHDYIFIRTSYRFRRWGIYSSVFAMLVTWILFGIWHGAGYNFMLLGLVLAVEITCEFLTKKWRAKMFSVLPHFSRIWLGRIFTYLFYGAVLVLFFAPDINSSMLFYKKLFDFKAIIIAGIRPETFFMVLFFISIFMILEIIKNDSGDFYNKLHTEYFRKKTHNKIFRWSLYFSIITIVIVLSNEVQQFIYFQF